MGATSPERYAVVSCHVERPLDDAVWARFSALQEARPGGFAIAALMRPADPAFGEDEAVWANRAREAAARAPLGHHTHWTAPDHARPSKLVTISHKPGSGPAEPRGDRAATGRKPGSGPAEPRGDRAPTGRDPASGPAEPREVPTTGREPGSGPAEPREDRTPMGREPGSGLPELREVPTTGHEPGSGATAPRENPLVTISHKGPGERVAEEGGRFRELGLSPTLFCGGGWYTDASVAEACAALGYVDCTPRARRPPYLSPGEPWASLGAPATIELPSGATLRAFPTTHSLGDLARAIPRRLPDVVHVYLHDTDLRSARRRALLRGVLVLLARRALPTDLDALAAWTLPDPPRVAWDDVARL